MTELPLERVGDEDDFPLSFVQRWYFDEYAKLSYPADHHISCALHLSGVLDSSALKHSVHRILARQSSLRTRFVRHGSDVRATVEAPADNLPAVVDLTGVDKDQREHRARECYLQMVRQPFRLFEAPLIRIASIKLDEQEHVLVIVLHHIVGDVRSLQLVVREIAVLYEAALAPAAVQLAVLPFRFCDYVRWERRVDCALRDVLLNHWRARLDGLGDDPFSLPADQHPIRDLPSRSRVLFGGSVSSEIVRGLRVLARAQRSTLFCVLAAAVSILLQRWSGYDDRLIIVVRDGRDVDGLEELEGLVGCGVTNWGLRVRLGKCATFADAVQQVWRTYCEDLPYMQLPYYRVRDLLASASQRSAQQIVLNHILLEAGPRSEHDSVARTAFYTARLLDWRSARTWVDDRNIGLYFTLIEKPDALDWSIRCAGRRFSDSTMERLSRGLDTLLRQISVQPVGCELAI